MKGPFHHESYEGYTSTQYLHFQTHSQKTLRVTKHASSTFLVD